MDAEVLGDGGELLEDEVALGTGEDGLGRERSVERTERELEPPPARSEERVRRDAVQVQDARVVAVGRDPEERKRPRKDHVCR